MAKKTKSPITVEQIDGMIRTVRDTRVILDSDLAKSMAFPRSASMKRLNAIAIVSRQTLCFSSQRKKLRL